MIIPKVIETSYPYEGKIITIKKINLQEKKARYLSGRQQ